MAAGMEVRGESMLTEGDRIRPGKLLFYMAEEEDLGGHQGLKIFCTSHKDQSYTRAAEHLFPSRLTMLIVKGALS